MLNIKIFRVVSLVEGLSFLVLLFIAMPAKYHFGYPEAVSVVGMTHGLLFSLFFFMTILLGQRRGWSERYSLFVILAGVLPFGWIVLDKSLKRQVTA